MLMMDATNDRNFELKSNILLDVLNAGIFSKFDAYSCAIVSECILNLNAFYVAVKGFELVSNTRGGFRCSPIFGHNPLCTMFG